MSDALLDENFVGILTHIKLSPEHFAEEVHLFLESCRTCESHIFSMHSIAAIKNSTPFVCSIP